VHEGFEGQHEQEASRHSLWQCPRVPEIVEIEEIRRGVWYSKEVRTCWKCGMIDYLCERGSSSSSAGREKIQQNCAWPNVVIPLLCGLRAAAEEKATLASDEASARSRTTLGRVGYREKDSSIAGFSKWISSQYTGRRVFSRVASNGVAAVVAAILEENC
jgi:hypothetical protein